MLKNNSNHAGIAKQLFFAEKEGKKFTKKEKHIIHKEKLDEARSKAQDLSF